MLEAMATPRLGLMLLLFVCPLGFGQQTPTPSPTLDLTPEANGTLSQAQMQQLFRVVADKDLENDKRQRDYTYIERQVEDKLDGKGNTKSSEVKTYEVLEIY